MPLINHITGTNTNDATATAADILSPKTAYVKGELITGEIETKDNSDLTVSGATVSVPAGYYEENASKSVDTVTHPKPSATFNSSTGIFTASHTQSTGYVTGGTTTATSTITVNDSSDLTASGKTVTVPAGYYASTATKSVSTATQATPTISVNSSGVITASSTQSAGYVSSGTKKATYTLSSSNDSDFIASNIKSGKTIFGITGTLESGRTVETGTFYTSLNTIYTTISVSCSFTPSYFFLFYNGSSAFEYASYYPLTAFGHSGSWGYSFSYDGEYGYIPHPASTSSGFGLSVNALPVTVTQNGSTLTFSAIGDFINYGIMGIGKNYQWIAIK